MTTLTAVVAEVLPDLSDAPHEVRLQVGAELLYALGILQRPGYGEDQEAA